MIETKLFHRNPATSHQNSHRSYMHPSNFDDNNRSIGLINLGGGANCSYINLDVRNFLLKRSKNHLLYFFDISKRVSLYVFDLFHSLLSTFVISVTIRFFFCKIWGPKNIITYRNLPKNLRHLLRKSRVSIDNGNNNVPHIAIFKFKSKYLNNTDPFVTVSKYYKVKHRSLPVSVLFNK